MSQQVTEWQAQQYNANTMHLSQQKGSRLQGAVRRETQKGVAQFFDRLGLVAAVKRTSRHGSTPQIDTPHSRRMVTLEDFEWGDMVDDQDKLRMIHDPTSDYAMAAAFAFGRSKDDTIVAASVGNAYSGEKGTTPVAHPDTQKYAANNGSAFTNLNVATLRAVAKMMDAKEVEGKRYFAFTASQKDALLGQTEVTSSDYNTVKALVQGEINTFLGFEFIRLERLLATTSTVASPTTGAVGSGSSVVGFRSCFAWAEKGLLMSVGEDFTTKIGERPDKGFNTQVYAKMSIGATRMEEEQVVEVICKES